jgi:hypothetical protein
MRRAQLIAVATVMALAALIAGCAKEYSLEGSGQLPTNGRCISCTYLPFCDSSEFTYLVNGTDTLGGAVHLLGDTSIGGQTFNKVGGYAVFNAGLFYNCANQEYRGAFPLAQFGLNADTLRALIRPVLDSLLPLPPGSGSPALSIPDPFYTTILKANAPAGTMWLDTLLSVSIPITQGPFTINVRLYAGIEYTYLEKDISRTVPAGSFPFVQHVQGKPKIGIASIFPIPLPLPAIDGQVDFYLAKNVGMVELNVSDSTGVRSSAKLLHYRL